MADPRPVALATGASGGMGGAIVRELASTHRVIATGRDEARLAALAADVASAHDDPASADAPPVETWALDVTDEAGFAERIARLDRLDVLVHAAAVSRHVSVADAPVAEWLDQLAVDVVAPATITRLALPLLRRASGTVIFIGSGPGTKPVPGSAVYTSAKHALRGLADVLRIDEERHRVRVATLAPGQTDTAMLRSTTPGSEYDPSRYIQPSSVASTVRFIVDAPADVHITDVAVRPRREIASL